MSHVRDGNFGHGRNAGSSKGMQPSPAACAATSVATEIARFSRRHTIQYIFVTLTPRVVFSTPRSAVKVDSFPPRGEKLVFTHQGLLLWYGTVEFVRVRFGEGAFASCRVINRRACCNNQTNPLLLLIVQDKRKKICQSH